MKIALAADHAGFALKENIKEYLQLKKEKIVDLGTHSEESIDYPDIACKLARAIAAGEYTCGILICGTGIGVSITANKISGVRAAVCHDSFSTRMARKHNDANVLALGARVTGPGLALDIVDTFLQTDFEGGRHCRRLEKIFALENKGINS